MNFGQMMHGVMVKQTVMEGKKRHYAYLIQIFLGIKSKI
jgi:hypothetical protein